MNIRKRSKLTLTGRRTALILGLILASPSVKAESRQWPRVVEGRVIRFDFSGRDGAPGTAAHRDGRDGGNGADVKVKLRADLAWRVLQLEILAGGERYVEWLRLPWNGMISVISNGGNGGSGWSCSEARRKGEAVQGRGGYEGSPGRPGHISVQVSRMDIAGRVSAISSGASPGSEGTGCYAYEYEKTHPSTESNVPDYVISQLPPLSGEELTEGRRRLGLSRPSAFLWNGLGTAKDILFAIKEAPRWQ